MFCRSVFALPLPSFRPERPQGREVEESQLQHPVRGCRVPSRDPSIPCRSVGMTDRAWGDGKAFAGVMKCHNSSRFVMIRDFRERSPAVFHPCLDRSVQFCEEIAKWTVQSCRRRQHRPPLKTQACRPGPRSGLPRIRSGGPEPRGKRLSGRPLRWAQGRFWTPDFRFAPRIGVRGDTVGSGSVMKCHDLLPAAPSARR